MGIVNTPETKCFTNLKKTILPIDAWERLAKLPLRTRACSDICLWKRKFDGKVKEKSSMLLDCCKVHLGTEGGDGKLLYK